MSKKKPGGPHGSHARKTAHAVAHAAAHTHVHDDHHATDTVPEVLELTSEQKDLISTLGFFSEYELHHMRKVAPDVAAQFSETIMGLISRSAVLGGHERAKKIEQLVARHDALTAVAQVVGPIMRLIGQNILETDSELGRHAAEVLKHARGETTTQPHLLEGLSTLNWWSKTHHGHGQGRGAPDGNALGGKM